MFDQFLYLTAVCVAYFLFDHTSSVLSLAEPTNKCDPSRMKLRLSPPDGNPCFVPYQTIRCTGMVGYPSLTDLSPELEFLTVQPLNNNIAFCVGNLTGKEQSYTTTLTIYDDTETDFQIPVDVFLQDMNSTVFLDDLDSFIPENTTPGEWRVQLNPENRSNIDITLSSIDMPRSLFRIEKTHTEIFVVFIGDTMLLDVDRQSQADYNNDAEIPFVENEGTYIFHITARSKSNASSTARVQIQVLDVNDNRPYCSRLFNSVVNISVDIIAPSPPIMLLNEECTDNDREYDNRIQRVLLIKQTHCEGAFMISNMLLFPNSSLGLFFGPCYLEILVGDPDYNVTVPFTINLVGCREDTDKRGHLWRAAGQGQTMRIECPPRYSGSISRRCTYDSVYLKPKYRCTSDLISGLLDRVQMKPMPPPGAPPGMYDEILQEALTSLTDYTDSEKRSLEEGDLIDSGAILAIVESDMTNVSDTAMASCVGVVDNLIASNNTRPWQDLISSEGHGAERLFGILDRYAQKALRSDLTTTERSLQFPKKNLMMELGKDINCDSPIQFLHGESSFDGIKLACPRQERRARYSSVYYRNISDIVPVRSEQGTGSSNVSINAAVMSFTLFGNDVPQTLTSPIEITFQMFNASFAKPVCSYWNQSDDTGNGSWANNGCWVARSDSKTVVCACNHLTNFALLMSPGGEVAEIHQLALSFISAAGCTLSMILLLVTIIVHGVFWNLVRSDKSVILMQLCSTLLLAYLLFMAGINRTNITSLCTFIAVMLHFVYLVVFFLMLAEGLNLGIVILFVFMSSKRNLFRWLIIQAWCIPLLIVTISASVTQLDGYGNKDFCWLSVESGLIWAFVGPALLVIVLNMAVIVAVVRTMLQTAALKSKSDKERTKSSIRSLCVLLPITGCAWVLGVFSVNSSLVVFQYAFAVLNTLQGLFIFIFHCLLNRKIQKGVKLWRSRSRRGYLRPGLTSKTGTTSTLNTNNTAVSQL